METCGALLDILSCAPQVAMILGYDLKVIGSICWLTCLMEVRSFLMIPHMVVLVVYNN